MNIGSLLPWYAGAPFHTPLKIWNRLGYLKCSEQRSMPTASHPSPDRMDMAALARCSALKFPPEPGAHFTGDAAQVKRWAKEFPCWTAALRKVEAEAAAFKARAEKAEARVKALEGLCMRVSVNARDRLRCNVDLGYELWAKLSDAADQKEIA